MFLLTNFSAVVPRVRVTTQTRVAKGKKMGRAQAIQNCVVCFQRHLLVQYVPLCSV